MRTESTTISDILIWSGVAISLLGVLGLIWCILRVSRAKRSDIDDAEMRKVLQSALPLNLGALFLSMIGLMMVILAIFLA